MKKVIKLWMAVLLFIVITPQPKVMAKVKYEKIANGTYNIVTKVKGNMMLDVASGSSANGANIQIYQNNASTAQQFKITHVGSGWYKICNSSSGKSLDVTGASKKSGVNVQLYDYNGTNAQLWRFYSAGNGYYYIQNKLGYYLDVTGAKTTNGTNVQVYSKNTTNSQKWKPIKIVSPTSVKLNSSAFTLRTIGATKKLTATISPSNATHKNITWISSNNNVAVVSGGTVKAVGSGTATITAKTVNGKKTSIKVTVNDGCASIKEGVYTISTRVGSNMMLDVTGNGTVDGTNIDIYKNNGSVAQKYTIESVGNGWYIISNTYPKKCLDVKGGSKKSGTNVQLYSYNKSDSQKWRFYSVGNGYYKIMNKLGCYLNVDGAKTQNGTNVSVYSSNKTNAQKWKLTKTNLEYVNIVESLYSFYSSVGNNMVLDVTGNGIINGTNIQIYQGNDSIAQKFYIKNAGGGWYKIFNPLSGKCLDVQGANSKNGANVQLYSDNGTAAQRWRIYQVGNTFVIKNKLGYCLDVQGASSKNGTNVQIYQYNNTKAQKWSINKTSAIMLNSGAFTLDGIGKTKKLSVSYLPTDVYAANKTITWSSSNKNVAVVSNGTVKAVGAGNATITAKAYNGKNASVVVTVNTGTWNVTNNILSIYSSVKNGYVKMSEYPIGIMYAGTTVVTNASRYANVDGKKVDMLAWQCFGYARYIQQKLYGCHDGNAPARFVDVSGYVASGRLTVDKIKSVVNKAGVGAHIRTSGKEHSMIIIGITSDGFTVTDANSDGRNTVNTKTYTWKGYVESKYGKRGLSYVKKYIR